MFYLFLAVNGCGHTTVGVADTANRDGVGLDVFRQSHAAVAGISQVVDIGTCKGWTLEQVAERRAPSLKFYVRGCSDANNILKAAATLLLTDLEQKKAG